MDEMDNESISLWQWNWRNSIVVALEDRAEIPNENSLRDRLVP